MARGNISGRAIGRIWTNQELDILCKRFPEEGTRLSTVIGCSRSALYAQATRMGLKTIRTRHEALAKNNESVNYKYFDSWSDEMARMLGYTWADGSITHTEGCNTPSVLTYSSKEEDRDLVDISVSELNSKHHVSRYVAHGEYPQIKVSISSAFLVRSLMSLHGLEINKSDKDLQYRRIDDRYLSMFFQGYFDGDGWVSLTGDGLGKSRIALGVGGTPIFIKGLVHHVLEHVKTEENKFYWYGAKTLGYLWSTPEEVKVVSDWMYQSLKRYGRRKKSLLDSYYRNNI